MSQFNIVGNGIRLVIRENVLAVLSEKPLTTISSAFHNGGGLKDTKAILNVEVLKSCSDQRLHDNPEAYITEYSKKFGLKEPFIGMVTAASIQNFALVSKGNGELAVSVIATAADNEGNTCNYAESAGETINVQEGAGTINIIVLIDGNPTESCLAGTLITVTEAKMAAMRELDVRSRFSGTEATGTVTDSIVAAKTNRGAQIIYGGPASELGQLVGYCARKAVKEAITKAKEFMPSRSIKERLKERHLSTEKLALELSKENGLLVNAQMLEEILETEPIFASLVMAAAKMDDDVKKGLVPSEFASIDAVSRRFGSLLSKAIEDARIPTASEAKNSFVSVDLPPFTKHVLIGIVRSVLSKEKTENLK